MLFAEMIPLCEGIHVAGRHITIETAGTLYLPLTCDVMSISPKMSNSAPPLDDHPRWRRRHEQTRKAPEVIRQLIDEHAYQFKFVIDRPADAEEVLRYLDLYPQINRQTVFMMPQGTEAGELEAIRTWLEPWCDQHQLQFGPRRQIEWFGALRGT